MKKQIKRPRNWVLFVISLILGIAGLALVVISIVYMRQLGWWAILYAITGLGTMASSYMSIKTNDPSWMLLNLILPY